MTVNDGVKDVITVIGKPYVDFLIDDIRCGKISEEVLGRIAYAMHPHAHGLFVQKLSEHNFELEDVARAILNKWFTVQLFKLKNGEGASLLIQILEDESNFQLGELVGNMKQKLSEEEEDGYEDEGFEKLRAFFKEKGTKIQKRTYSLGTRIGSFFLKFLKTMILLIAVFAVGIGVGIGYFIAISTGTPPVCTTTTQAYTTTNPAYSTIPTTTTTSTSTSTSTTTSTSTSTSTSTPAYLDILPSILTVISDHGPAGQVYYRFMGDYNLTEETHDNMKVWTNWESKKIYYDSGTERWSIGDDYTIQGRVIKSASPDHHPYLSPVKRWFYFAGSDWTLDTYLTVQEGPYPYPDKLTVSSTGPAGQYWPDCMGVYNKCMGDYNNGRPIWKNAKDIYLYFNDEGQWCIYDDYKYSYHVYIVNFFGFSQNPPTSSGYGYIDRNDTYHDDPSITVNYLYE